MARSRRDRPRRADRRRDGRYELGGKHDVDTGVAELVGDRDDPGGWTVTIDGVPHSYVHLDDPTRLEFEYMQWIGYVLDAFTPAGEPVRAVHIGGAGCALSRYLASTRPGSRQIVFEIDAALVTLMRRTFALRSVPGLRLRAADGLTGLGRLPDASADIVIRDAFARTAVPKHLTTVLFHREADRVLGPGGLYVANVADTAKIRESRVEAAAALEVFDEVALIAEPGQLRGRRYGNVVLVASHAPLPEEKLVRRLAGAPVRARYVPPARVRQLVAGVAPSAE